VTRIEWDGTLQRRMVDTACRGGGLQWEDLAARALAIRPVCRPVPRLPVYRVRVDDVVVQAAEHDLTAALLDLITAVLALGEGLLASWPDPAPLPHRRAVSVAACPADAEATRRHPRRIPSRRAGRQALHFRWSVVAALMNA
jgi:hypothetical protein